MVLAQARAHLVLEVDQLLARRLRADDRIVARALGIHRGDERGEGRLGRAGRWVVDVDAKDDRRLLAQQSEAALGGGRDEVHAAELQVCLQEDARVVLRVGAQLPANLARLHALQGGKRARRGESRVAPRSAASSREEGERAGHGRGGPAQTPHGARRRRAGRRITCVGTPICHASECDQRLMAG